MGQDKPALKMIREFVAVGRASFERPHTAEGDPDAQRKLVEGIEVRDDQGERLDVSGSLVELLAPRALFFDQRVLDAIKAGVTQIVNVGAGYDDRALRFRHADVQFFEIDLAHVIDDKARRLESIAEHRSWPTLIPADLRSAEVADLLMAAGLKADEPTLFICEHVLLFIGKRDVQRLLAGLSRVAARGSTLALSAEVHPEGVDTDLVVSTVDDVMFANVGLLHSIRSREDWIAGLRDAGWIVDTPTQEATVNHFALPVAGRAVQIQTRFMTAAAQIHGARRGTP